MHFRLARSTRFARCRSRTRHCRSTFRCFRRCNHFLADGNNVSYRGIF